MQARAGEWRMATKEETYNALTAEKNGGVKERGKKRNTTHKIKERKKKRRMNIYIKKKEGKKKNVY